MQLLGRLLENISPLSIRGNTDCRIENICIDSRKVSKSSLFIAIKGTLTDGHKFIESAIRQGAVAVVCESLPDTLVEDVCYIVTDNSYKASGLLAAAFYGFPSDSFKVIGITGTNGKTTVATLLHQLFSGLGYKCGLLSTVNNIIGSEVKASTHTTPEPISLQNLFAEMVDAGCDYCFMEVSSHAVDQYRIEGVKFYGAVFTNLTHDHLDYHKTFENYLKAKKKFFDNLDKHSFALVNADDKNGRVMVQNTRASIKTYGLRTMADFKGKVIQNSVEGLHLEINNVQMHSSLIGEFNAYNLLAVYGAAVLCGMDEYEAMLGLSSLKPAEGRFEIVKDVRTRRTGIVDYSHTPDALEKILQTIKDIRPKTARILLVVGCGGDRDKTKRPVMAHIGVVNSDVVILTSDNPRSEDPEVILDEMWKGIDTEYQPRAVRVTDRKQAIKMACLMSDNDDIIVVAGKGHEKYQEIKGEKFPFDDLEILKQEINENIKIKK